MCLIRRSPSAPPMPGVRRFKGLVRGRFRVRDLRYFNLRPFELDGRLYELLGVRQFKRFASAGDFFNDRRRRSDPEFRNVRNYSSAIEWEARTRFNELAHLGNLVFSVVMLVWLCLEGRFTWIVPILFLNLILNVYPIMLQRYNRARIRRIRRMRERLAHAPTVGWSPVRPAR